MSKAAPRHPSLVRRLVLLASVWSLAVLVVAGLGLSAYFTRTEIGRAFV